MTPLLAATTAAGAAGYGPWLRNCILAHSVTNSRALRNHCPRCRTPLATGWPSRLPVTGRCPLCRRRIGPAAGTVEFTAAATVAAITSHSTNPFTLTVLPWITWYGIILSHVDATVHRLPPNLTARAFIGAATLPTIAVATISAWRQLLYAIGGAVAIGATDLIIISIRTDSLGHGDAKLAPAIGLILTWFHPAAIVYGLNAAVTIGIVAAAVLLITRRVRRHRAFARGPSCSPARSSPTFRSPRQP